LSGASIADVRAVPRFFNSASMARQDKYYFGDGSEGTIRFVGYPPSSMIDFPEEKLDKIYELYHQGIKFTDIRKRYPEISKTAFEYQLPYIKTEQKCEKCDGYLYHNFHRRANGKTEVSQTICIGCGHFPNNSRGCECKYCEADKNEEAEANKKLYYDYLNKTYKLKTSLLRLDLFEEIYLFLAILNYSNKERQYLDIESYHSRYTNTKPNIFDREINRFIQREILIPYTDNFHSSYLFEDGVMD